MRPKVILYVPLLFYQVLISCAGDNREAMFEENSWYISIPEKKGV